MAIQSTNPNSGRVERKFDAASPSDIEEALSAAQAAYSKHKSVTLEDRAAWLTSTATTLRHDIDQLSELMTREMGKTRESARAEIEKCAWVCDFYAQQGKDFLADRQISTENARSFVRYLPLGPVLAVMPWNFPFWQVFRFAAPALLAGNTALLKHASNVPQCALAIEEIFRRSGVPNGTFQTLLIGGDQVERVLKDERVRAVTLTGSEDAGRAVASIAGNQIKKVVLELGGSDPFIVMPSANIDDAIDAAIKGRMQNNGQSCIAAKRFIAHKDIYADFRDQFVARIEALKVGDPMEDATDIGPLATRDIRNEVHTQVEKSIAAGADCAIGCRKLDRDGWFYQPGLLENIPSDVPAAREEIFGPVASLFRVDNFDGAIAMANQTRFGLGSAVFTQDPREMEKAFNEIEAGATFINSITASDPRLPFGGIKTSGVGRELAEDGMREFMNLKTCVVA